MGVTLPYYYPSLVVICSICHGWSYDVLVLNKVGDDVAPTSLNEGRGAVVMPDPSGILPLPET